MTPEERLGKWVRTERTARGWSQRRLADEMKAEGFALDPSGVTRTEKCQRPVSLNEAVALAEIFGASIDEAIGGAAATLTLRVEALEAQVAELSAPPDGPSRRRMTDEHLIDVATVYRAAWQGGGNPTQAVADQFNASHSTAARWVGMARKAEFLPSTDPGRPAS